MTVSPAPVTSKTSVASVGRWCSVPSRWNRLMPCSPRVISTHSAAGALAQLSAGAAEALRVADGHGAGLRGLLLVGRQGRHPAVLGVVALLGVDHDHALALAAEADELGQQVVGQQALAVVAEHEAVEGAQLPQ